MRIDPGKLAGIPAPVLHLARRVEVRGGRAYLVGGYVRDLVLGQAAADLDVEVFGLPLPAVEEALAALGEVLRVGKAFGVLRVRGLDVDFSLPRRDSRAGRGHRGFHVETDPAMKPAEAVRRRDLTVNALLLDPLSGEVLDPAGGLRDIHARTLRAVDPRTFPEDPLRPLRVAQMTARLEYDVEPGLLTLCRRAPLTELPRERIWDEWEKLLLRGRRPSRGLAFLAQAEMLDATPELDDLVGVPQDLEWHPEGDVWEHTLQVVDAAATLRTGRREEDLAVLLAALCHDLGKARSTEILAGRWHSYRHEMRGLEPTRALLERLGAPGRLRRPVEALVRWHLQPGNLVRAGAGDASYRRLSRDLEVEGTHPAALERVARADALGRTSAEATPSSFPEGDRFLERLDGLRLRDAAPRDVVLGRHLLARGLRPGPQFGPLLARCREVQDETGWDDPDRILDRVLGR